MQAQSVISTQFDMVLSPVARRHIVTSFENSTEMSEVIEASGESDFTDRAMPVGWILQIARASFQPDRQKMAAERGLLLCQEAIDVPWCHAHYRTDFSDG